MTIHRLNVDNPGVTEPAPPRRFTERELFWLFMYLIYFPAAAGAGYAFVAWLVS